MKARSELIHSLCVVSLVVAPALAQAQQPPPTPENSAATCSDGIDNDGDGYVDCADQDCQRLPVCNGPATPVAPPPDAPPPPAVPPPPPLSYPVYQPPPPPPVYQPPPIYGYVPPGAGSPEEQPPFGLPTGIIGASLLVVGIGMLAGSAGYWVTADCSSTGTIDPVTGTNESRCRNTDARNTGIVLDVVGGIFFVTGVVMTPIGFSQFGNYLRWKHAHPQKVSLVPSLHANSNGAMAGFKLTF